MSESMASSQLVLLPQSLSIGASEVSQKTIFPKGSQEKPISRKEYNSRYYQANKERIQKQKKKKSRESLFSTFGGGTGDSAKAGGNPPGMLAKALRLFELLALIVLVLVMTYFLVTEAAGFYIESHEAPFLAYLKAAMVEGIAVLFSFSKGKGLFLRWSQRVVVVLLCSLTLWTMSGKVYRVAMHDAGKSKAMSQVVRELESERTQKESLQQALINKGWIGATRRVDKTLEQIKLKLTSAREEASKLEAPHVILNGLGILVVFRLLIVAANLICIHLVAEHLGLDAKRKEGGLGY